MEFEQIISIHGGPRYGTSWLGQIFDSSKDVRHKWQPLFSDSFKNKVPELNTKSGFLNYYNDLYNFEDDFLDRTKQIFIIFNVCFYISYRNSNFFFLYRCNIKYFFNKRSV